MNDADAIRRTVRRSTAVLVLSVSVLVGSLDFEARGPAIVLGALALVYLAGSAIYAPRTAFEGTPGGADESDPDPTSDGT